MFLPVLALYFEVYLVQYMAILKGCCPNVCVPSRRFSYDLHNPQPAVGTSTRGVLLVLTALALAGQLLRGGCYNVGRPPGTREAFLSQTLFPHAPKILICEALNDGTRRRVQYCEMHLSLVLSDARNTYHHGDVSNQQTPTICPCL